MQPFLLLEPHADFRAMYGAFLSHAGYAVYEAVTCAEAERILREFRPAAAVVSLASTEGWAFLEDSSESGTLVVIGLTWDETGPERERLLRHPRARYAQRPSDLRELACIVTDASPAAAARVKSADGLA